ncbi:MAG: iron-containing alcohol dehydrogenase [Mycoplasmataceae bacterium]|nr:iron-containing alcohol dehydrogenase [Mycoplasmataceae bacterium]
MINTIQLNTKYIFGKDVVTQHLQEELSSRKIKTIMLVYGGGSIKKNGLYQEIINVCKKSKVKVIEHSGIEPNPRDVGIYQASITARKNKVQLIIAAGGGSVIDACKVIGILATNPQYKNAWDYVVNQSKVVKPSIPLFSIVTLAATGSESNAGSVITNAKTHYKRGTNVPSGRPIVAFEDPKYTLTLSWWQTACGIFDIFSHLCESYFDVNQTFEWTKQYILANMRVLVDCAKILKKNNQDYDARANLLWTSSWALNDLNAFHTNGGDWTTHKLEHAVSGLWDVPHGAGLALLTPNYLKYMCKHNKTFIKYCLEIGKDVFKVNTLEQFFKSLISFIKLLGLPQKFTDFDVIKSVSNKDIEWLVNHFCSIMKYPKNGFKFKLAKFVFESVR